jgi:hypothetical protein
LPRRVQPDDAAQSRGLSGPVPPEKADQRFFFHFLLFIFPKQEEHLDKK